MNDANIARVTNVYRQIRDKMTKDEIQLLSGMLYIDVLHLSSERVLEDERLKMESFRARTSWKNESFTPLSWEKKVEKKVEPKVEKKAEPKVEKNVEKKAPKTEKTPEKETFRPLSNPELSHEEWEKAMQKNCEEQMKKLPF